MHATLAVFAGPTVAALGTDNIACHASAITQRIRA